MRSPGVDTETPGGDCGDLVPPLVRHEQHITRLQQHGVTQNSSQLEISEVRGEDLYDER